MPCKPINCRPSINTQVIGDLTIWPVLEPALGSENLKEPSNKMVGK